MKIRGFALLNLAVLSSYRLFIADQLEINYVLLTIWSREASIRIAKQSPFFVLILVCFSHVRDYIHILSVFMILPDMVFFSVVLLIFLLFILMSLVMFQNAITNFVLFYFLNLIAVLHISWDKSCDASIATSFHCIL